MTQYKTIETLTSRGFNLTAFANDTITAEIQSKGEYDHNTLSSLSDVLPLIQANMALDIGANIGNHALVIAKHVRKLIAFEPVGFIYEVLQKNIDNNRTMNAAAENLALSDQEGVLKINVPNNNNLGTSSIDQIDVVGQTLDINTIPGDEYLRSRNISDSVDFIKIDVEGHEVKALQGLQDTIKKHQPLILIEWKSTSMIQQFNELQLFDSIFNGYQQYALTYTTNKKLFSRSLVGLVRRQLYKAIGNQWCLTRFDPDKRYSNVYFIPKRYQQYFQSVKFVK